MPKSTTLSRAFAITSNSWSRPIAAKTGLESLEMAVGAVLCATMQMEQDEPSVLLGWLWVDSATAVHNIRDRQSHVNHRPVNRMRSCFGVDSIQLITVACTRQP
jgi:hypothetical protein